MVMQEVKVVLFYLLGLILVTLLFCFPFPYFLVKEFAVSDVFSTGPYKVEILSGNEQRRFEVKDKRYSSPSPPTTAAPPSFVLDGETVYLCPNATANATVPPIATFAPGELSIE